MSGMGVNGSKVFVSHSSALNPLAEAVATALRAAGHWPRIDRHHLRPGDVWRKKLSTWMLGCDAAIVLVCDDALESDWVRHEVEVLASRVNAGDGLDLIVQPVGVARSAVRSRFAGLPAAVREIQMPAGVPEPNPDRSGAEIAAIATAIAAAIQPAAGQTPLDLLAEEMASDISEATAHSITDVVRARDQLASISAQRYVDDPWVFDRIANPVTSSEQSHVRHRFAHELCTTALTDYYDPLDQLPDELDRGVLVDRGLQSGIDGQILDWVASSDEGSAVIAIASSTLAELCPSGAHIMRRGMPVPEVFVAHQKRTSDKPSDWARGLLNELSGLRTRGRPFLDVCEIAARRGKHIFVIVTDSTGLTAQHLEAAASIDEGVLAPVRFVLLPNRGDGPLGVGARTDLRCVGHEHGAGQWAESVDAELEMIDEQQRLRRDLRRN